MEYPNTLSGLKEATEYFFKQHWNTPLLAPRWEKPYDFVGPLPKGDKQGVYAFLTNEDVVYIGVGASRNPGCYEGAGLGARLNRYMRVKEGGRSVEPSKRPYVMIDEFRRLGTVLLCPTFFQAH